MIFRFDDVFFGANMKLHNQMADYLFHYFPSCEIIWACSPMASSSSINSQRIFPREWNALSDVCKFYQMDLMGHPVRRDGIVIASHGLIHADHRLLSKGAQELSILLSCSLLQAKIFVPPFNKWDMNTEYICDRNNIKLIKFEDGWRCMEYNSFSKDIKEWYLHAREWTMESFKEWFEK